MEKLSHFHSMTAGVLAIGLIAGCGSSKIKGLDKAERKLPKPDLIYVHDFAVSPDEVELDDGVSAKLTQMAKEGSRTEQEKKLGKKVANALADQLVKKINKEIGIPAKRVPESTPRVGNTLVIDGQFLSIDQGNRTARVMIGFGAGRSVVDVAVQMYELTPDGRQPVEEFQATSKSGRKPGAAATMGVGAATGHLAISSGVTAGAAVASEAHGATVTADARRAANKIVEMLEKFSVEQKWIAAKK